MTRTADPPGLNDEGRACLRPADIEADRYLTGSRLPLH